MHIFRQPPEIETKALLSACGLPIDDLNGHAFHDFFGCGSDHALAGVVGVELYGPFGLLRSLAVAPASRGRGFAKRLVSEAEAYAVQNGVSELYLLTETASRFFASLGYETRSRESAPHAIRSTTQFGSLCPDSAAFMMKRL
jgi:amino-acid N-acetyltransferase